MANLTIYLSRLPRRIILPFPPVTEDLVAKGDVWVFDGTELKRLPVGKDREYLEAESARPLGIGWAAFPGTSKGDLQVHTGSLFARFPRGADGEVLTVDDGDLGFNLSWKAPTPGGGAITARETFLDFGTGVVTF